MMEERKRFTEEELAIVKSVDLTAVAASLGYTIKQVGHYHTLKEMDSIRIYNRTNWFHWSREHDKGNNGGSQIDFLRVFAGMEIKEAVFWLQDFAGCRGTDGWEKKLDVRVEKKEEEKKKPFILPYPADSNHCLYEYLTKERALSQSVVDYFVNSGLVYEEKKHHNIVFKGNDRNGKTRFANMRGVSDQEGRIFKCDVAGNDKNYGFNVWNEASDEVMVFEGAIDLLSYMDIREDYESNKVPLGMVSDAPLAIKTPFEVKRKLLSEIVSYANGAIESCEKLSQGVLQKEKEKQAERTLFQGEERQSGLVAEPTYKYGAEAFEAKQEEVIKAMNESMTAEVVPVMNGKKR